MYILAQKASFSSLFKSIQKIVSKLKYYDILYIVCCMKPSRVVIYIAVLPTSVVLYVLQTTAIFLDLSCSFSWICHLSYSVFSSVCVWECFLAPCPHHSAEEPVCLRLTSFRSSGIGVSSRGQKSCIQGCLEDSSISIRSFPHDLASLHEAAEALYYPKIILAPYQSSFRSYS